MRERGQAATVGVIFVGLVVIAVGGLYVYNAAYADVATTEKTFINESSTDTTGVVALDNSNLETVIYVPKENVSVYDENDTLMDNPGDYTWNRNNGTLSVNASGDLAGDASLNATYGYSVGNEQAQGALQVTGVQRTVMRLLVLVVGVGALLVAMRVAFG